MLRVTYYKITMKKAYVALVLVLLTVLACRAEYLPILEKGRSWIVGCAEEHYGDLSYVEIKVTYASHFNGRKYKLDIFSVENEGGNWVEGEHTGEFWAVEEEGVIYNLDLETGEKNEILSLALQPGDFTSAYGHDGLTVEARMEMEVAGQIRTCIYAGDFTMSRRAWIIEGIGASVSVWQSTLIPTSPDWTYKYTYMVECRQDGEVIFTEDDFTRLPVPGTDSVSTLADPMDFPNHVITDITGIPLTNPIPGKICIRDGKKILLR